MRDEHRSESSPQRGQNPLTETGGALGVDFCDPHVGYLVSRDQGPTTTMGIREANWQGNMDLDLQRGLGV